MAFLSITKKHWNCSGTVALSIGHCVCTKRYFVWWQNFHAKRLHTNEAQLVYSQLKYTFANIRSRIDLYDKRTIDSLIDRFIEASRRKQALARCHVLEDNVSAHDRLNWCVGRSHYLMREFVCWRVGADIRINNSIGCDYCDNKTYIFNPLFL